MVQSTITEAALDFIAHKRKTLEQTKKDLANELNTDPTYNLGKQDFLIDPTTFSEGKTSEIEWLAAWDAVREKDEAIHTKPVFQEVIFPRLDPHMEAKQAQQKIWPNYLEISLMTNVLRLGQKGAMNLVLGSICTVVSFIVLTSKIFLGMDIWQDIKAGWTYNHQLRESGFDTKKLLKAYEKSYEKVKALVQKAKKIEGLANDITDLSAAALDIGNYGFDEKRLTPVHRALMEDFIKSVHGQNREGQSLTPAA